MKKLVTPLSVGVVTVVGIGFLLWGVFRVKKGLPAGMGSYQITAMFPDAAGLGARTRVVLAGVIVGQIEKIELAGDKAKVSLSVREDAILYSDAQIAKRQASVLGDYYLELIPGVRPPRLKTGDVITKVQSAVGIAGLVGKLGGVTDTISRIAKDVQRVTRRVAGVFGTQLGAGKMRQILDSTAQIARRINEAVLVTTRKLNRILTNFGKFSGTLTTFTTDTAGRVKSILGTIGDIAGRVRGIVASSGDSLKHNFGQVRTTLDGVKKAVSAVNRSLGHIETIVGRVNKGEGLVGALTSKKSDGIVPKAEKLVDKVGDVVDNVGDTFSGVSEFLSPLLRMQPIFDLHTEISMRSAKIKNYVGLRLQVKHDKYYMIELVDDPRGKSSFRKVVTRSTSSQADPVTTEEQIITENALKFSFMLAKKFYFTTWRFGLKESTGGIGLDFNIPGNLEVQFDFFDFIGDDRPRLKALAFWQFYKPFYLHAGADDLFNSASRDYFVGVGLRFTDEDVKSLLLVAPTPK